MATLENVSNDFPKSRFRVDKPDWYLEETAEVEFLGVDELAASLCEVDMHPEFFIIGSPDNGYSLAISGAPIKPGERNVYAVVGNIEFLD